MKTELQKKLVEEFPQLFSDYGGDPKNTCMAWGISFSGSGWYSILHQLCVDLMEEIKTLPEEEQKGIRFTQIKEKMGSARFYLSYGSNKCFDLCDEAERRTEGVCEICGANGKINKTGYWLSCRCEECRGK